MCLATPCFLYDEAGEDFGVCQICWGWHHGDSSDITSTSTTTTSTTSTSTTRTAPAPPSPPPPAPPPPLTGRGRSRRCNADGDNSSDSERHLAELQAQLDAADDSELPAADAAGGASRSDTSGSTQQTLDVRRVPIPGAVPARTCAHAPVPELVQTTLLPLSTRARADDAFRRKYNLEDLPLFTEDEPDDNFRPSLAAPQCSATAAAAASDLAAAGRDGPANDVASVRSASMGSNSSGSESAVAATGPREATSICSSHPDIAKPDGGMVEVADANAPMPDPAPARAEVDPCVAAALEKDVVLDALGQARASTDIPSPTQFWGGDPQSIGSPPSSLTQPFVLPTGPAGEHGVAAAHVSPGRSGAWVGTDGARAAASAADGANGAAGGVGSSGADVGAGGAWAGAGAGVRACRTQRAPRGAGAGAGVGAAAECPYTESDDISAGVGCYLCPGYGGPRAQIFKCWGTLLEHCRLTHGIKHKKFEGTWLHTKGRETLNNRARRNLAVQARNVTRPNRRGAQPRGATADATDRSAWQQVPCWVQCNATGNPVTVRSNGREVPLACRVDNPCGSASAVPSNNASGAGRPGRRGARSAAAGVAGGGGGRATPQSGYLDGTTARAHDMPCDVPGGVGVSSSVGGGRLAAASSDAANASGAATRLAGVPEVTVRSKYALADVTRGHRTNYPVHIRSEAFELPDFDRFLMSVQDLGAGGRGDAKLAMQRIFHMLEVDGQRITSAEAASDPRVLVAIYTQDVLTDLVALPILDPMNTWTGKTWNAMKLYCDFLIGRLRKQLIASDDPTLAQYKLALEQLNADLKAGPTKRSAKARALRKNLRNSKDLERLRNLPGQSDQKGAVRDAMLNLKRIERQYGTLAVLPPAAQTIATFEIVGIIAFNGFMGRKGEWEIMSLEHVAAQLDAGLESDVQNKKRSDKRK